MTTAGHFMLVALGVYLSIRMIAALYQVIDLWYRIGTDNLRVARSVVGWAAVIAAVASLLDSVGRAAFVSGLVGFLVFYLSLFGLRHVLIAALRKQPD